MIEPMISLMEELKTQTQIGPDHDVSGAKKIFKLFYLQSVPPELLRQAHRQRGATNGNRINEPDRNTRAD